MSTDSWFEDAASLSDEEAVRTVELYQDETGRFISWASGGAPRG